MAYKNDWKKRQKKIDTPPKSEAGYGAMDTEDTTDAPNVAKSVSARGDLGSVVKSHRTKGGPQEPQTKTPTKITSKKDDGPSKRVETAFQKHQRQLKQAAIDAKGDKDLKTKKKPTSSELAATARKQALQEEREAKRDKNISKLDEQTIDWGRSGRRKKVKRKAPVTKKSDRAISKSANVEAPDEKTATVKVPSGTKPGMIIRGGPAERKRKAKLTGTGVEKRPIAPVPPKPTAKVTTPEPKKNGAGEASKRATAKDATAETVSADKMKDRPESRRKRHVAEDRASFGISRGGTKEDPSSGYRVNPFGKNKTKAEADKAMSAAYAAEQEDRKKVSQQDYYQYGEGRRSKLKQTAKKGGPIRAKHGRAIKKTYNTGGTIRLKSGGAVVDTYDY